MTSPLQLLSISSFSIEMQSSVRKSKLRLFTGGLCKCITATPTGSHRKCIQRFNIGAFWVQRGAKQDGCSPVLWSNCTLILGELELFLRWETRMGVADAPTCLLQDDHWGRRPSHRHTAELLEGTRGRAFQIQTFPLPLQLLVWNFKY